MHPFFAPLDRYELAVLLTAMGVAQSGEAEAQAEPHTDRVPSELFRFLAEPMRSRLKERAEALMGMPPEPRKSLVTTELKALLNQRNQSGLNYIDATWLVHALRGESPRVVATLLLGLEPLPMRNLLKRLPHSVRSKLPPKSELMAINEQLAFDLRQLFAERFARMPEPPSGTERRFEDLLFLERDELYRLIRDLGLTELGQAFAAVEKVALLELCRRLGKAQAHELLDAVQSASKLDQPDAKSAQHFLSKIVVNFDDTEEFLQKSGLWRLARATYRTEGAWRTAFAQRLPRQAGGVYAELANRAEELLGGKDDDVRLRLRDAIMLRVALLARQGHIGPNWRQATFVFHDQAGCQAILDANDVNDANKDGGPAQ